MGAYSLNIQRRGGGVYYCRKVVPEELRSAIGRREIVRSLRTTDPTEARRAAKVVGIEIDDMFAQARRGVSLSVADADSLAHHWFRGRLDDDMDNRSLGKPVDTLRDSSTEIEGEWVEIIEDASGDILELYREALNNRDFRLVSDDTSAILAKHKLPIAETSDSYLRLSHAVLRWGTEFYKIIQQRNRDDFSGRMPEGSQGVAPRGLSVGRVTPVVPNVVSPPGTSVDGELLSGILERWVAERKPSARTESEWRLSVRRFSEVVGGDLSVASIEKKHVRDFKDALLKAPVRVKLPRGTKRDAPPPTLPELIALAKDDPRVRRLSPAAVNKGLRALSSIFGWSVSNGYMNSNPALGLTVTDPDANREKRVAYDIDDLKLIFERSPVHTGCLSASRWRHPGDLVIRNATFWFPLLAIFTGARLEEMGQALVKDIKEEEGIWYLDINTLDDGKKVKTKSSRRKIPLHSEIIRCSFLDYVSKRKEAGDGRLFPDVNSGEGLQVTSSWSKKWGPYARGIGITDPKKTFHSTRHTFKEACRKAEIEEQYSDAISGHSSGSVGRTYGGYPVGTLAREIEKIRYPGLDLSHLYIE